MEMVYLFMSSRTGYYCNCKSGYTKDPDYSYTDNCWKQIYEERIAEVGGGVIAGKCGTAVCLNGGRCVNVTKGLVTYINSPESNSADNLLNQVPMCQCPSGYTGLYCDVIEGIWGEWNSWSNCAPTCGQIRYRYRLRSCDSDIGCHGSGKESQHCTSLPCTKLSVTKKTDTSIKYAHTEHDNYYLVQPGYLMKLYSSFLAFSYWKSVCFKDPHPHNDNDENDFLIYLFNGINVHCYYNK
ncbi:unnamed protein product [Heterobilharzia americana]|nr:unnamed protein product [Heterobilharzia americana]